jgi:hypothetical protein
VFLVCRGELILWEGSAVQYWGSSWEWWLAVNSGISLVSGGLFPVELVFFSWLQLDCVIPRMVWRELVELLFFKHRTES